MKKADLERTIDEKVSRSREELQREWSNLANTTCPPRLPRPPDPPTLL